MVTLTIKNIEHIQNTILLVFLVVVVVVLFVICLFFDTFILYIHSSARHNIVPFNSFIFSMQHANKESSECPKTKRTQRLIFPFGQ